MSEERWEQYRPVSPLRAWLTVLSLSAAIVAWGLLNYTLIPDGPRTWDFGILGDVPGQSTYSDSQPPAKKAAPPQIEPLPEGRQLPDGGVK